MWVSCTPRIAKPFQPLATHQSFQHWVTLKCLHQLVDALLSPPIPYWGWQWHFVGRWHFHAELVNDELDMVNKNSICNSALDGIIVGYYWWCLHKAIHFPPDLLELCNSGSTPELPELRVSDGTLASAYVLHPCCRSCSVFQRGWRKIEKERRQGVTQVDIQAKAYSGVSTSLYTEVKAD